ncbi:hypothetical protein HanHA300_Chr14g0510841 [Helianthus annuus]|nr:hypothetical protein HanHA300_Chr14g0510841 [Helianthus annuus]
MVAGPVATRDRLVSTSTCMTRDLPSCDSRFLGQQLETALSRLEISSLDSRPRTHAHCWTCTLLRAQPFGPHTWTLFT